MNLIEKLGLEKCKQILDGAGESDMAYNTKMRMYTNGFIRCSSDVFLDDLRTALADHDRTDYVSDIRNHIAPTTVVIER